MQDCLLRVPMILCAPSLKPSCFDGLSEHVDIPPTVLDLLGVAPEPEWGIHGTSLLKQMNGGQSKDFVFADGGHEDAMIRRFNTPVTETLTDGTTVPSTQGKQLTYSEEPESMSRTKMVRSRDWKLVVRLAGGNELYHLPSDPLEMNNLYGHPEHAMISAHLMEALVLWSLRTDTDRPFLTQVGA